MREFVCNIEQKVVVAWGDVFRLEFLGWAGFVNNAPIDHFIVAVNGEAKGELTGLLCPREDVAVVHPLLAESGDLGFHVIWEIPVEEVKGTDRVTVVAVCKDASGLIWASSEEGLGKDLEGQTMRYSIDKITPAEKWVEVAGWAVSGITQNSKPEIVIYDPEGNEVPYKKRETDRRDAAKALLGEKADPYVGFTAKFEYDNTKKYTICFKNNLEEIREEMDLPEAWRIHQIESRPFKPMNEIMKEYSGKDFGADVKTLFKHGVSGLQDQWKLRYATAAATYETWFLKHKATPEELEAQKKEHFAFEPVISIVVPAYQTPKKFLKQMIDSVQKQSYSKWELCIADGSDKDDSVRKAMAAYRKDKRIRYHKLKENKGISGNTNAALRMATGDVITLLDHDDILAYDALYELVKAFNADPEVDVVYTDEDKVEMDLRTHFDPHFKTDFNIDLLRSNNYICHLFAAKKEIVDQVKGFRKEFDGSQDFDFILRCTELARKVSHIPKILYHWRSHQNSTAANPESKMYCYEAGKRAIEAHLKRSHQKGTVSMLDYLGYYHVDYEKTQESLVSILIPNKDEAESLKLCINSILEKTTYPNYEIIIIENNSTSEEIWEVYKELEQNEKIRVVVWKDIFNYSGINNFGASHAKGDYLVLLNNDTEIITPRWLDMMLADCQREEVGIVGTKLLYPDNTIQHCGVIIGMGGIAGHVFVGQGWDSTGYFTKTQVQQDLSAVTAACLMISKKLFDEVGGLDEQLKVAFNDVDFCLRVRETGHLVMLDPRVQLYHYESKSRGTEDTPEKMRRFDSEVAFMKERWSKILEEGDPYYNKNLTLSSGDCGLRNEE